MITNPNMTQADRDRLAEPDLPDLDDRVGIDDGHQAQHIEEVTAQ